MMTAPVQMIIMVQTVRYRKYCTVNTPDGYFSVTDDLSVNNNCLLYCTLAAMKALLSKQSRRLEISKEYYEKQLVLRQEEEYLKRSAAKGQQILKAREYYAASRVQSIVRGFLDRLVCSKRRRYLRAVRLIQKVMKGKLGNNDCAGYHLAAVINDRTIIVTQAYHHYRRQHHDDDDDDDHHHHHGFTSIHSTPLLSSLC